MKLNYENLKIAIEHRESLFKTITMFQEDEEAMLMLQAAKLYLPILLHQEFIKPNEHGNTDK